MLKISDKKNLKSLLFVLSLLGLFSVTLLAKKYTDYPKDFEQLKLIDTAPKESKFVPEDKGGEQFENQDKNVFQILD